MNHRHLEGGDFLHARLSFADVGGEVIIDVQLVEYFLVHTIDTTDALDDARWIVRYVVIVNRTCPVEIIALGNGIRGNQYLIIVVLFLQGDTSIEIQLDGFLVLARRIFRCIDKHRQAFGFQFLAQIVNCVGKLAEHNNFPLGVALQ